MKAVHGTIINYLSDSIYIQYTRIIITLENLRHILKGGYNTFTVAISNSFLNLFCLLMNVRYCCANKKANELAHRVDLPKDASKTTSF